MVKAEGDTEEEKLSFGRHHASRVEHIRSLEERIEEEEQKGIESTKDQSTVVAELEECVAVVELERDGVRLESEKGRSSLSTPAADPTKAEEDANAARKALKEEEPSFGRRVTSHKKQNCRLEEQLKEEQRRSIEIAKD